MLKIELVHLRISTIRVICRVYRRDGRLDGSEAVVGQTARIPRKLAGVCAEAVFENSVAAIWDGVCLYARNQVVYVVERADRARPHALFVIEVHIRYNRGLIVYAENIYWNKVTLFSFINAFCSDELEIKLINNSFENFHLEGLKLLQ